MHPVLFQFGGVTLYSYGVLVALGVLVGLWLARRQAAAPGLEADRVWNLGLYMVLAALVGAKLWQIIVRWEYYAADWRGLFRMATLQAAGVFYGGLLAALVVAGIYVRIARLDFLALADVYAAPLALGHAIGLLRRRLLLGQADGSGLGRDLHRSPCCGIGGCAAALRLSILQNPPLAPSTCLYSVGIHQYRILPKV